MSSPDKAVGVTRSNSRSSSGPAHHPLLGSSPDAQQQQPNDSADVPAKYAVYQSSSVKRRPSSTAGMASSTASISSPVAPSAVSPHLEPTSPAGATPPLISRPSNMRLPTNSTLPPAALSTRPKSRSVSEAKILLQGQNLKADVQALGLPTESAGWAMVQKLQRVVDEPMFSSVVAAAQSERVTLCLPVERLLYQSQLTPAFFLDHLVLLERVAEAIEERPLVRGFATLTGFRGTMISDMMHLQSCGTALSSSITGLSSSASSISAVDFTNQRLQDALTGAAYPAAPIASTSTMPYPNVEILSPVTQLSIPKTEARTSSGAPPTPATKASSSTGSRIAAALFGKGAATASPAVTTSDSTSAELPPVVAAPADVLSEVASDSASLHSRASIPSTTRQLIVNVMTINKPIKHVELVKQIAKATDASIRDSLRLVDGCDSDIADRLCQFASKFIPPPAWTSCIPPPGKPLPSDSYYTRPIVEVSDAAQDLFHAVRLDLTRHMRSSGRRQRSQGSAEKDKLDVPTLANGEKDLTEEDLESVEERVDQALERIEETLLTTLYDRLFASPLSNDAKGDEELSVKIESLNDLHLSLEHLGLDFSALGDEQRVAEISDALEDLVKLAADELGRLQDTSVRTPRAKLAVFVNVHKIIVDGLSRLPPIPLKKETEAGDESDDAGGKEIEMAETPSRETSRPVSPGEDDDDDGSTRQPAGTNKLATSMHEAATSSVFETTSRRQSASSSADLILPILIYVIVRHPPARLRSHLHFIQRFRAESLMRGEASYCATNVHAATEFLCHVELSSLGLTPAKLMSVPSNSQAEVASRSSQQADGVSIASGQQFDSFVDTANRQIVNVVDSSYRILFGIKGFAPRTIEDVKSVLDGAGSVASKARGSLLRRQTSPAHFGNHVGSREREMTDLSPPPTVTSFAQMEREDDTRSLRSISSLLRDNTLTRSINERLEGRHVNAQQDEGTKASLGERFASLPVIGRLGGDTSAKSASGTSTPQRSSVFNAFSPSTSPQRARSVTLQLPADGLAPDDGAAPIQRFLDCQDAGELRLSEVEELLKDYQRLASIVSATRS